MDERAGYFSLIVFLVTCACILCHFLALLWVGLRFVIVSYPGHTHLHFGTSPAVQVMSSEKCYKKMAYNVHACTGYICSIFGQICLCFILTVTDILCFEKHVDLDQQVNQESAYPDPRC